MTIEDLEKYINKSEELDKESYYKLDKVAKRHPYFHTAHLLLAKNRYLINPKDFKKHLHEASALCADRKKLFYLINSTKYDVFFEPDETEINMDRTEMLLDSFLTSFTDEEETKNIITEDSFVSTDYLSYLEKTKQDLEKETEDSAPSLQHQEIIDNFLEKSERSEVLFAPSDGTRKSVKSAEPEEEESGGFLTETLARIYIKQKKYEQALTIIQQLSLNFPKKSSYFADQIRFLELLILNEKNKKQ